MAFHLNPAVAQIHLRRIRQPIYTCYRNCYALFQKSFAQASTNSPSTWKLFR